jgi:hypothetical protein
MLYFNKGVALAALFLMELYRQFSCIRIGFQKNVIRVEPFLFTVSDKKVII